MSTERDPMVATRVPFEMMELMDRRMRAGNYASTSEYIRDLIRRDLEERGLTPGPAVPNGQVCPDEASPDPDLNHRKVIVVPDQNGRRVA